MNISQIAFHLLLLGTFIIFIVASSTTQWAYCVGHNTDDNQSPPYGIYTSFKGHLGPYRGCYSVSVQYSRSYIKLIDDDSHNQLILQEYNENTACIQFTTADLQNSGDQNNTEVQATRAFLVLAILFSLFGNIIYTYNTIVKPSRIWIMTGMSFLFSAAVFGIIAMACYFNAVENGLHKFFQDEIIPPQGLFYYNSLNNNYNWNTPSIINNGNYSQFYLTSFPDFLHPLLRAECSVSWSFGLLNIAWVLSLLLPFYSWFALRANQVFANKKGKKKAKYLQYAELIAENMKKGMQTVGEGVQTGINKTMKTFHSLSHTHNDNNNNDHHQQQHEGSIGNEESGNGVSRGNDGVDHSSSISLIVDDRKVIDATDAPAHPIEYGGVSESGDAKNAAAIIERI